MNTLSFIARFRTPALLKVALAPALCPRITLLKAGGMRPPGMYAAELALPTITVGFGDWPTATAGAVAAVQPEGAFATIGVGLNPASIPAATVVSAGNPGPSDTAA